mgnify:CR=1 FL=1
MKINDEGTSNAAHWYERAMKAESRLAEAEALIHEAVELLRMWVIWDSMADDAKSPHQKTDTFLLLRRRK